MREFRTFLVPYDFSDHARAALSAATELAARLGADVHLLHVIQPPSLAAAYPGVAVPAPLDLSELHQQATSALVKVASEVEGLPRKIEPHVVEASAIAPAIVAVAEELGADLIVMGTHGRTGLAHVFLGSVAERTLRNAPCPVLSVQASETSEPDASGTEGS